MSMKPQQRHQAMDLMRELDDYAERLEILARRQTTIDDQTRQRQPAPLLDGLTTAGALLTQAAQATRTAIDRLIEATKM